MSGRETSELLYEKYGLLARIAELERYLVAGREEWKLGCDRITELEAELAALKQVADAMEDFIDSCTYHMRDGDTVNYEGARGERGTGCS